ncbi:MAG: hypothetical protein DWH97_11175 [Planctomycetota bacterium]|nr:MAG: hypothetical protein DWH97_11175 [Planctomycetota bacterium]
MRGGEPVMLSRGDRRINSARRGRYWELYTNQFAADKARELLHLKDEAKQETITSLIGEDDD